jgi:hypothetical protein
MEMYGQHLQFDIRTNAVEIWAVQSLKFIVWCAFDCTVVYHDGILVWANELQI